MLLRPRILRTTPVPCPEVDDSGLSRLLATDKVRMLVDLIHDRLESEIYCPENGKGNCHEDSLSGQSCTSFLFFVLLADLNRDGPAVGPSPRRFYVRHTPTR